MRSLLAIVGVVRSAVPYDMDEPQSVLSETYKTGTVLREIPGVGDLEILGQIGETGYGLVMKAESSSGDFTVIAACDHIDEGYLNLEHEAAVLSQLQGAKGVPQIFHVSLLLSSGDLDSRFMVLQNLGGNVFTMFEDINMHRRRRALMQFAIGATEALRDVHTRGWIHDSLSMDSFYYGPDGTTIMLVDFESAKRWHSYPPRPENRTPDGAWGSDDDPVHIGVFELAGSRVAPRDDLLRLAEILYILWDENAYTTVLDTFIDEEDRESPEFIEALILFKKALPGGLLTRHLGQEYAAVPHQVEDFMRFVMSLEYDEDPDCDQLIELFKD
jgi:serine/threonine protein kinase